MHLSDGGARGRLTHQKYARRMAEALSIYRRGLGHYARDCTNRSGQRTTNPRFRAAEAYVTAPEYPTPPEPELAPATPEPSGKA